MIMSIWRGVWRTHYQEVIYKGKSRLEILLTEVWKMVVLTESNVCSHSRLYIFIFIIRKLFLFFLK